MHYVRISLIIGLTVLLTAGCGGGESWSDSLDVNNTGIAYTTGNSTAPEDMKPRDQGRVELSGGQVETCKEGSIYLNAYEKRILELHNQTREQRELESLCVNPTLTEAAYAHSKDMTENDYFSHTSASGESLGERLKRFGYTPEGYSYWKVGGNIAWHSNSEVEPESIFEGWMNSPGHRSNILDEDFRQIGIGTYTGEYMSYEEAIMYTVDFGVRHQQ